MLIHNAEVTGSLLVNGTGYNTGSFSGSFIGAVAGTTATASYVEYNNVANKPALVSGSSQITYSGLTGIPSGIVSGSAQVAGFGIFATTGSNQFNGSQAITGSLTVTGQVVAQTLNVQQVTSSVVFSSGSNVFGNSLSNTQQFTGSVGMTGSLTVAGAIYAGGATSASALTGASELIVQNEIGIQSADSTGPYLRMVAGNVNQNFTLVTGAASGSEPNLLFNVGGSTRLTISGSGAATFSSSVTAGSTITNQTSGGDAIIQAKNGTVIVYGAVANTTGELSGVAGTETNHPYILRTFNTEKLRITPSGSVGIGTTSPVATLNVSNVPTSFFGIIETTGTSAGTVKHFRVHKPGYVEYGIGILADNSFHISTESTFPTTDGFTITSAGNVGIGTTAPISTLLNSALTIYKVYNSDSSSIPSPNAQLYGNNQSGLYLFGRNSGLTIVGANSEQNQIIFANSSTVAYASINTTTGTSSTGGDMYFNVGSNTERMRITSDGYVTKPYQPAFRAGRSASYAPGANSNIIFNSVFFNIGSHYNASNGLFTAPIAGRYYFSASVIWESVPDGQEMDDAFTIRANGNIVAYDFRRAEYVAGTTGNGGYYVTNANILLNLAANDTVSIRNNRNLTVHGNEQFSWFVGYLLG